jgi:VanZ family protein
MPIAARQRLIAFPMVKQRHFLPWLVFIACASAIAWLSLTPSPPSIAHPFLGWDKFQHASAYAILTLTGGWALGGTCRDFGRALILALIYGGGMELAQGALTRNRTADWLDFLANLTGAATVVLIAIGIVRRKEHP